MLTISAKKNGHSNRMPHQGRTRQSKRKYHLFPTIVTTTIITLLFIIVGTCLLAGITYALHLEAANTRFFPAVIYGLAFFIGCFFATVFTKGKSYFPIFLLSLEFSLISLLFTWGSDLPITVTAAVKMVFFIFAIGMISHICAFMVTPKKKKTARVRPNNTAASQAVSCSRYDLSKYNLDL